MEALRAKLKIYTAFTRRSRSLNAQLQPAACRALVEIVGCSAQESEPLAATVLDGATDCLLLVDLDLADALVGDAERESTVVFAAVLVGGRALEIRVRLIEHVRVERRELVLGVRDFLCEVLRVQSFALEFDPH